MSLEIQPDGLTAGLAGHCQPDKRQPKSQKEEEVICTSASRKTRSRPHKVHKVCVLNINSVGQIQDIVFYILDNSSLICYITAQFFFSFPGL